MAGNRINRRDFVTGGALAAGALAAGLAEAQTRVPAKGGAPAPAKAPSTRSILNYNENMEYRRLGRTGLMVSIGTGAQGTYLLHHMGGLQGCRCAAVCDTDEANLKKGAAAAGTNPQVYRDYRELLGRKDIDAVVIATPLSTHFPITRDALAAGKHVFCEPPLVFKPEEDRNPVDVQMESFFDCCRTGDTPKADVAAGLANSTAVILSNLAMDQERRVYFNEIEKMGLASVP
jgi:hypothetical protein